MIALMFRYENLRKRMGNGNIIFKTLIASHGTTELRLVSKRKYIRGPLPRNMFRQLKV